jgi:hypothetical protein
VPLHRCGDDLDHVDRSGRAIRKSGQTLAGVFVDQGQDPEAATVDRLIMHKIPAPNLIGPFGLLAPSGGYSGAAGSSLALSGLEAPLAAHSLHALGVHLLPFATQQRGDSPVAVAREFSLNCTILTHKRLAVSPR